MDTRLIEDTWAQLDPRVDPDRADDFALTFYEILFTRAPAVRALFPLGMQKQRHKLMVVLGQIVRSVTEPEGFDQGTHHEKLTKLGASHVGFGAQPVHYEAVGAALLTAMKWMVDGWTPEHADAWGVAYGMVVEVMLAGARAAEAVNPDPYVDGTIMATEWSLAFAHLFLDVAVALGPVVVRPPDNSYGGWVRGTVTETSDDGDGRALIEIPLGPAGEVDLDALVIAAMNPGDRLRVAPHDPQEDT